MSARRSDRKLSLIFPVWHALAARDGSSRCADSRDRGRGRGRQVRPGMRPWLAGATGDEAVAGGCAWLTMGLVKYRQSLGRPRCGLRQARDRR